MADSVVARAFDWAYDLAWPFRSVQRNASVERDIADVQALLTDGVHRVRPSPVSLSLTWFPYSAADIPYERTLSSDYGGGSGYPDVDTAFHEEVMAFTQVIDDAPVPESAESHVRIDMLKRGHAMNNWRRYAIPLRLRGSSVVHVTAPRDLLGSPIVLEEDADEFLAKVSEHTARDAYRIKQLEAQRSILLWVLMLLGAYLILG